MKSSSISGAIAGFVAGSVAVFTQIVLASLGLQPTAILKVLPFTATVHIGFNTIWFAVFGVLYSKFYDVIPSKGAKKGLVYGLIIYLMIGLLPASYYFANGNFLGASGYAFTGLVVPVIYGLLQGVLYDGPKQPVRIEDKIKHNLIAGPVAGLLGGVVAAVLIFICFMMGVPYGWYWPHYPPITSITNVVAIELILMIVWGTIINTIFVMFYARIPGKGIMRGLYFGLLLCLLCVIRPHSWGIPYAANPQSLAWGAIVYSLAFISYGIVLGYLYKKE